MAFFFHNSRSGYPPLIQYLRLTVLILSLCAALWYELFANGTLSQSPTALLLSPNFSTKTFVELVTSPFLLLYPGLSLNVFFDLAILNVLVSPIFTFVLSYMSTKNFIRLVIGLVSIGATSFFLFSSFWPTPPCSLFSSLSLSIILFWTMLHSKGQSFFLLAFPLSPLVYLSIAIIATMYPILMGAEWAKFAATSIMFISTYFIAVGGFHLRSAAPSLHTFEKFLDNLVARLRHF